MYSAPFRPSGKKMSVLCNPDMLLAVQSISYNFVYSTYNSKMSRVIGELEEFVLLAVCILDGDGYGISVKKEVERHTGRSILLGAVHITLYRLQDKGLLESKLGGSSEKRGDRRKRLFRITKKGMDQLRASQEIRQKMWGLIPQLNMGS
jgi:PadR family transcriptional regulator PadR